MTVNHNKHLLITGTSRGIGLEYVKQYAEAGWQVIACCRSPATAADLHALAQRYPQVKIEALDVANFEQISQLAAQLKDWPVDLMINNAGVYPQSAFGNSDEETWLQAFKVNTMSTLKLAEAFMPHLVKAGNAKLVAMTSKMGSIEDNSSGGEYIYRTTKTALNMVVKSLAIDLNKYGITVAVLHPGWVRTDMGGPYGLIDVQTSVKGLRQVIAELSLENSGLWFAYDGKSIPW